MNQAFETWWNETYLPGMGEIVPVLMLAFKEVAQKAWEASHQEAYTLGFDDGYGSGYEEAETRIYDY